MIAALLTYRVHMKLHECRQNVVHVVQYLHIAAWMQKLYYMEKVM